MENGWTTAGLSIKVKKLEKIIYKLQHNEQLAEEEIESIKKITDKVIRERKENEKRGAFSGSKKDTP